MVEELQLRYQDLGPYGHVHNGCPYDLLRDAVRLAYHEELARNVELGPLEAGELPGVRYAIVEAM